MSETDAAFTGSIAEMYDRYLGPLLFAPYAADLANRARAHNPKRIVEIAAGTGIATRALASNLPDARIEATDLNEAMVGLASHAFASPSVRWSVADAMALPFSDRLFDLALCQFGVMFFPDPQQCYREIRRVLQPGGIFLFNAWDDLAHNDVARVVAKAVADAFPDNPPSFLARTPYGHGDVDAITNDLRAAGFLRVSSEAVELQSGDVSTREGALGFCEGTPLKHEILERDARGLPRILESTAQCLRAAFGQSTSAAKMRAFVFTANT